MTDKPDREYGHNPIRPARLEKGLQPIKPLVITEGSVDDGRVAAGSAGSARRKGRLGRRRQEGLSRAGRLSPLNLGRVSGLSVLPVQPSADANM